MSFKGITVMVPEENLGNITAADDAAIFQSLIGSDGVLSIGNKFAVNVISNNDVRVSDGVLCVGGHIGRIAYGDYNDMTIENGILGENRNDIIYAKFLTSGNYDTFTIEVKKGDSVAGTAKDPDFTQGILYENATLREIPLWRVKLEELSIVAVEQMFTVIPTIPELLTMVNLKGSATDVNALKTSVNTINTKLTAGYVAGTAEFKYKGAWDSTNTGTHKLMYIISDGGTEPIIVPCNISIASPASPVIMKNASGSAIFQYYVSGKTLYVYVLNSANKVGVNYIL